MYLESLGTSAPPYGLTLEDRHEVAEHYVTGSEKDKWFVPYIFEKSKVDCRRSVLLKSAKGSIAERQDFFLRAAEYEDRSGPNTLERMQAYEEYAADLAVGACRDAFSKSEVNPEEITHLVTASCTGFYAPGFDLQLIDQLSLPRSTSRTHLGFMGCHAGLNCLRTARAYAAESPSAKVLVCSAELCSLHYQYAGKNDQKVANAIFADGAAAAIVTQSKPSTNPVNITTNGSYVVPETTELMTWKIEDHGFAMGLSESIPQVIESNVAEWLGDWLGEHGLDTDSIKTWAVHPGGPQILIAFQSALRLNRKALQSSWDVLRNNGNMSSATIFFVLNDLLEHEKLNLPCVAIGFGPGLTIEACLLT